MHLKQRIFVGIKVRRPKRNVVDNVSGRLSEFAENFKTKSPQYVFKLGKSM